MTEYDVIVVGGGPTGLSVAKITAEKGTGTVLLEEHPQIGSSQHYSGFLHGTKSGLGNKIPAAIG